MRASTIRRIIGVVAGVGIVGALVLAFMPQAAPVDLAEVRIGRIEVTADEDGRTRLKDRYQVSAPLAGRLLRIELDEGDPVVAGRTVLAAIEPSPPSLLDARAEGEAQMRVRAAEAALARTEPELAAAEAALQFARGTFEREHEAQVRGGSSQQQLDRATLELRQAEEAHRAAAFAQDIAEYELAVARAALTRAFDDTVGGAEAGAGEGTSPARFEVRSPIDGLVTRVFQESAGVVAPGQPLLEVGDPRDLEVEVDVLSVDAVRIREGSSAVVQRWGGRNVLACRVRTVEPSAFTKVSALGVEEQRVNVILDFEGDPSLRQGLGDGFRVETSILLEARDDVPLVPVSALFRVGREWTVFVVRDGRATAVPVALGLIGTEYAEVVEGLVVGDRVVLYPSDRVTDGARVRPRGGSLAGRSPTGGN